MSTTEQIRSAVPDVVIDGLVMLRRSFLLTVFVIGLVFLGLATFVLERVLAGMTAALGFSMIIVSVVSYALLWFNRYM